MKTDGFDPHCVDIMTNSVFNKNLMVCMFMRACDNCMNDTVPLSPFTLMSSHIHDINKSPEFESSVCESSTESKLVGFSMSSK